MVVFCLQQGNCSEADYAIKFGRQAAEIGCYSEALMDTYQQGLAEVIKEELTTQRNPESLNELTLKLDNHICARHREQRACAHREPLELSAACNSTATAARGHSELPASIHLSLQERGALMGGWLFALWWSFCRSCPDLALNIRDYLREGFWDRKEYNLPVPRSQQQASQYILCPLLMFYSNY